MTTIGALIGTGRSADIYEFGEGRVLRRGRSGPIPVAETDIRVRIGEPESFVHGDLHPGNILLTKSGPVVIDWEGAGVGARDADVATTWLLLETADADDVPRLLRPLVGLIRRQILSTFLSGVATPRPETIAAVCEARLGDKNMRPHELAGIRAFALRQGVSSVGPPEESAPT